MLNDLHGGPYPLAVGNVAPTQTKVWFNTFVNDLMVWNYATLSWQPVLPAVIVGASPSSSALGQLWLDENQKLWVHADDWVELTFPIPGNSSIVPAAVNGSLLIASYHSPQKPSVGTLWFEPSGQDLFIWNGFWVAIGHRVERYVRIAHPAVPTWNAGGLRTQCAATEDFLFLGGMRGINPLTQQQVPGPGPGGIGGSGDGGLARFKQVYANIQAICQSEGVSLFDCVHLFSTTTNAVYIGPLQNAQGLPQFWGSGPYPPRTVSVVLQMSGSDTEVEFPGTNAPRGDILEVQAIFRRRGVGVKARHTELSDALRKLTWK